jgi:urease accessory protein
MSPFMIKINLKLDPSTDHPRAAERQLVLPFGERAKSRLRARLDNGEEAGLILERGSVLRHGDLLLADDGRVIEVRAAPETVSTVHTEDGLVLARASYHLGNRHVPLQIGAGWLRYSHDHVLDDMLRGFGLAVRVEQAPFEPEGGAYVNASHHAHPHHHG